MAKKQETEIMDLSKFRSEYLPELQGKKEAIAEVIKANPIKEVEDIASYEEMKKSRTAVKTLRTGLERESKEVITKLKVIVIDSVKKEYDFLIENVKSAENQRQAKVDVWEEKKEQERKEKLRLEQERIDNIKREINDYVASWKDAFNLMTFAKIEEVASNFHESYTEFDATFFQEFESLFPLKVEELSLYLKEKISVLQEQEKIRIDGLVIEEKNAEQYFIQEWQRTWSANIDLLSVSDIADVKSVFAKSKLVNLRHYVSAYEEIYNSAEKRLHSQIEFVSKAEEQRIAHEKFTKEQAEIAKNNQIAQEKFEKEKKEFEEKQAEAKRKEEAKLEEEAIDLNVIDNQNYHEEDVDVKGIIVTSPIIFDVLVEDIEETWNSIYDEFEKHNVQDEYDDTIVFVSWLEKNYNVPTKKQ
jgi:hypothetical protein